MLSEAGENDLDVVGVDVEEVGKLAGGRISHSITVGSQAAER